MRYIGFVRMREDVGEPPAELVRAMGESLSSGFADGSIVDAGSLVPTGQRTGLRLSGGRVTTTDGRGSQAEVVGGYAILEARSEQEAVAGARRMLELHRELWPGWEGSVEVSRVTGVDDGPAPHS
jgi:hypothetical protein